MKSPVILAVCAGLAMLTAPANAHAQNRAPQLDARHLARIDALFADVRTDAPGYAIGIVHHGKLVHARGFGSANLDYKIPLGSKSVFNVASLAKQFTAASIGILIRNGKLSLEDEVSRYIPELTAGGSSLRIKHLVYMTSGLPEYYTLTRPGGRNWDRDYFTVEDALRAVYPQPLQFAPGSRWAYSNINYMLLTEIVRRVSGVTFAEFAEREIFKPLKMSATHFNVDLGVVVPNRATGYNARPDGRWQQEIRRSPHFGGSGLFTTVEDLARWSNNFETHQLGGEALTTLLLSRMKFQHDKSNDAFGLVWGTYKEKPTVSYEGGDLGFSSYMVRLPDERLTVIVLSNLGTGGAAQYGRRILDVLLAN